LARPASLAPRYFTERLAQELAAARPSLSPRDQRLALSLYRLLAEGEPVTRERLAQRAGVGKEEVVRLLEEEPGVYFDDEGRVVGFWGLALGEMPHQLTIGDRRLYAWCAWDTLFLPELLGATAKVTSTCPTTGEAVTLVSAPDGPREISPAGAVLSFLRRDTPFDGDSIKSFCHFVHLFASPEPATRWTVRHPGTFVLSIDEGVAIARAVNRASFAAALDDVRQPPPPKCRGETIDA
jgi:alkylmercury lyase